MRRKIVAAFLSRDQEFQVLQARDAEAAGRRHDLEIEVVYADMNPLEQIQQLFKFIHAPAEERPAAIVVETVVGEGLQRVARNAVQAGIGWVLLNRRVPYLKELRERFPDVVLSAVGTDQLEIGRIQGRQFRTLLPSGGTVLYLQGPEDTSAAQDRLQGAQETIARANIELRVLSGQWTEESVGSQNDAMTMGARRAIEDMVPEWSALPFTGCDGTPEGGQRQVQEGKLAATIITPSNAGPAIDLVAKALRGERAPAEVTLKPVSYPDEPELARRTSSAGSSAASGRERKEK